MEIGDTFLMDHPPGKGKHLVIVAEKIEDEKWLLLLVHVTSLKGKAGEDHSCILEKGDHEFISHESYIKYSGMFPAFEEYIEQQTAIGRLRRKPQLSDDVLSKVHCGAINSDALPIKYKKHFEKYNFS